MSTLFTIFFMLAIGLFAICGFWSIPGFQQGCNGRVDIDKTRAICLELEERREEGIHFNPDSALEYLRGGTCSAMAIRFLHSYLCDPNEIDPSILRSSVAMRELQAAYNTIEVSCEGEQVDYSLKKVQSLLNYFFLKIESSCEEIDGRDPCLFRYVQQLKLHLSGIYFIRILLPVNNVRLEERGHSMIYITKKNLFYDPGFGISYPDDFSEFFTCICKYYLRNYGVYKIRFYKILETK